MLVLTGVTGLFHACAGETSSVTKPTIWSRYSNFELLLLFISLKIDCFHTQYGFDCFHSQWSKTLRFQEYCYIPVASLSVWGAIIVYGYKNYRCVALRLPVNLPKMLMFWRP